MVCSFLFLFVLFGVFFGRGGGGVFKKQRKKKLRTAIEWDYGILPPSSRKGLNISFSLKF
jgi:hypothetical protein